MDDVEIRKLGMFTRVRDIGVSNAASFPPSSITGELFAEIGKIVAELATYAVKQATGDITARQGTATKSNLRDELRDDMLAISRTTRFMKVDEPNFKDKFRMPKSESDQALLTAARRFAADAISYESEFVRRELPVDFLKEFNNKIKLFEKAVSDQNLGMENRVVASATIDELIDRGMDVVKELDSIIKNKFRKDPAMLRAWEIASHVERAPRPVVVDETTEPSTAGD
jgi:hypothetical protein